MMDINKIKQKSIPIFKEAGVKRSSIFGSYKRGEQNEESDIDFLIELPIGTSLFDLVALQLKLEESLQRKVDLVEYEGIKPQLKDIILNDQIRIL